MPRKTVEEQYQKKTPIEHILLRPDTYIGSTESETQTLYTLDGSKFVQKTINFCPGLYKIFDEILVNAADNKIRDASMKLISVNITANEISVLNDGQGIPVEMHKEENVYVPELIFGHLLTSSNYDDTEKKVTGGRNGYGAKLCNIFSNEFTVETLSNKYYKQTWRNNMSDKSDPEIIPKNKYENDELKQLLSKSRNWKDFTKITFKPDFVRFGMTELSEDMLALMKKRVYDMTATVRNTSIYLNGEKLEVSGFKDYCKMYVSEETKLHYANVNNRWEVAVCASENFANVSFVNSVCTLKGGTHVNHFVEQLIEPLTANVKKKNKDLVIKPAQIKNALFVFVNALIENPSFDSQTKETLTLNVRKFGSTCQPLDGLVKEMAKDNDIMERITSAAKQKQNQQLKKTDGAKTSRLSGIPKLDDANMAGTKNSHKCTLILTEGDSAKTLAVSGLSVVGRDYYGVFPLKGKLLNAREASHKQMMENHELTTIKKILGLQHGKSYTSTSELRYGHIMIMADQDHDGSHIKGLLLNYFDYAFPSLLKIKDFMQEFITPIVRVTLTRAQKKGVSQTIDFFTLPEFEQWERDQPDKNYKVKYYKGLGTSTSADAKYYFSDLNKHVKSFVPLTDSDREDILLAFSKKKIEARKLWLKDFVPGTYLDNTMAEISIKDFINKELILFSVADNQRSIPSVLDGLKPGQRKVLYACFKRKLFTELKVAQLVGYVAEQTAYHHGEASLSSTIVNLAHNFVGSNNINLLFPAGQFGTRLQGGKDAASARYIFTYLEKIVRSIFVEADDNVLTYLTDDNQPIEPEHFIPIIPMVLVNGAEGIGTGWSTSIPNYNPLDIVKNIKALLDDKPMTKMKPWYRNYKGTITEEEIATRTRTRNETDNTTNNDVDSDKQVLERFRVTGCFELKNELEITELPIGVWTQNYKEFLENLIKDGEIKDFKEYHTENTVNFVVKLIPDKIKNIEKTFKLSTTISTNNMVCFNNEGFIRKYNGPEQILREFYGVRLNYYTMRKEYLLNSLFNELQKLENKTKFIQEVVNETIIIRKRKKSDLEEELERKNYIKIENNYDYLLNMSLLSLTLERIEKLVSERHQKQVEYDTLLKKSNKDLWLEDLEIFEKIYNEFIQLDEVELQPKKRRKVAQSDKKAKKAWEKYNFIVDE